MAMGRRNRESQEQLFLVTHQMPQSQGHPFYLKLNKLLAAYSFDDFCEQVCEEFYARGGRPGLAPGIYFRMLLIGFFENISSERGIAWRCADSLSLREFLGLTLDQSVPDHSTVSRTRRLIPYETHLTVFTWVLKVAADQDLLKGKTLGVDATTLEANAAMRSIQRRESGESHIEFMTRLAKESGIETPTREDIAKLDRNRKGKSSNKDWEHPHDPDASITKMKNGSTHMGHKMETAVDMESGIVTATTLHAGHTGDTSSMPETILQATENLKKVTEDPVTEDKLSDKWCSEAVADKGYHSNQTLLDLDEMGIRSYISEPRRGRRRWKGKPAEQQAVYANRRRIRGKRGKELIRRRGEKIERPFAHALEHGGMRRTHLRGHENILKRLLVHIAGLNLGIVMRSLFGVGSPKGPKGSFFAFFECLRSLKTTQIDPRSILGSIWTRIAQNETPARRKTNHANSVDSAISPYFTTDC